MRKLLLASLMALVPLCAQAEVSPLWSSVGDWQVRVDLTMGHGCFMMGIYKDGTIVRMGIDARPSMGDSYIMLGNPAWKSLEVGQTYSIGLTINNGATAKWESVAIPMGEDHMPFLILPFSNAEVWRTIAYGHVMTLTYQGRLMTTLPLSGTASAVVALANCQQQFGWPNHASTDPFTAKDPFAK